MEPVTWRIDMRSGHTLIEFVLSTEILRPSDLTMIDLPSGLDERRHLGLIISGRGPVWLYGHLLHRAHPFAWVAVYDPRLDGGVVVMNHVPGGPAVGSLV